MAFVADHVNAQLPPSTTLPGLADSVTTGGDGAGGVTVTVTLAWADPPGPVQLSTYVVVACRAGVTWLPVMV